MDGFRAIFFKLSLGKRTLLGFSEGKTLFSLHIGRFSCRFPEVFVRKTHVTLGFVEKKTAFFTFWTDFVLFLYVSVRKTYATLVVVAVVVAVGAVVVILAALVNAIVLVNIIVIAVLVVAVAMTIVVINILIIVVAVVVAVVVVVVVVAVVVVLVVIIIIVVVVVLLSC